MKKSIRVLALSLTLAAALAVIEDMEIIGKRHRLVEDDPAVNFRVRAAAAAARPAGQGEQVLRHIAARPSRIDK